MKKYLAITLLVLW